MGMMMDKEGRSVGGEARRESFVIYSDRDVENEEENDEELELDWDQIDDLLFMANRLKKYRKEKRKQMALKGDK